MSPGTQTAWPIRDRRSGYTLVELLVVMAIIALLVSLLMTGLRSVMRQANSLVCMSNLRQIACGPEIIRFIAARRASSSSPRRIAFCRAESAR